MIIEEGVEEEPVKNMQEIKEEMEILGMLNLHWWNIHRHVLFLPKAKYSNFWMGFNYSVLFAKWTLSFLGSWFDE